MSHAGDDSPLVVHARNLALAVNLKCILSEKSRISQNFRGHVVLSSVATDRARSTWLLDPDDADLDIGVGTGTNHTFREKGGSKSNPAYTHMCERRVGPTNIHS